MFYGVTADYLLGLSLIHIYLGGFPQGYLEIGTSLGLLEQVSEQQGDISLTRGDMAIMVCNSLGLEDTEQARLLYQGQGSIRIVSPEGKVIYIDPYAGTGYDLPADLILVTHDDPDHNKIAKVALRNEGCQIITQDEALAGGVHPVSYTQLDVYKRQVWQTALC